jgi:hypothetical protein
MTRPATPRSSRAKRLLAWAVAALASAGCGAAPHRYPLEAPMWVDPDRRAYVPQPEASYTSWAWDAIDNTLFRPLSEVWLYEEPRPAINVNSVDEVARSSWWQNRIGFGRVTPAEVAEGACAGEPPPAPPYTVVAPKAQGSSPGFLVEDATGRRYLFKIDYRQPLRPTAADAIGTRIFWAVGYNTPCNRVLGFRPDEFRIGEGVPRFPDEDEPMRRVHLQEVFEQAVRLDDGRLRGSLSLYVEGEPLGGWRFEGTREDDPNDVVPHEHRREARGMYVLSAWLDHIDSRAENNLDTWVAVAGRFGYVRHYVLDVGDSFGVIWPVTHAMSRRFGHSHYVDLEHVLGDLVSLGFAERGYHAVAGVPPHPVFGYYDVIRFEPDQWRNGYPNPAFERRTEHDMAWMARIISRFREAHLRAAVASGHFPDPRHERELLRILRGRQRKILERYLTRLSPLSFPVVTAEGEAQLCLQDLAVESGIRRAVARRDRAVAWLDWPREGSRVALEARRDGAGVCAPLPSVEGASPERPRYLVVDVVTGTLGRETTGPAQVHLYQVGPRRYRVVGMRRLEPG